MFKLEASIRMVLLQFSFSNPSVVPSSVPQRPRETVQKQSERKRYGNGTMVIEPTVDCNVEPFLIGLEDAGFTLVDAFYEQRPDPKDPTGRRIYQMVRYTFVSAEYVRDLAPDFQIAQSAICADLQFICQQAAWRVRSFLNPFFTNRQAVQGQYSLAVNLDARRPLFQGGKLIAPAHRLEMADRIVQLISI